MRKIIYQQKCQKKKLEIENQEQQPGKSDIQHTIEKMSTKRKKHRENIKKQGKRK